MSTALGAARLTWGGDEFLLVEVAEEMSLHANFRAQAMCRELGTRELAGIAEICPSNASFLVKFDPEVLEPDELVSQVRQVEAVVAQAENPVLQTRVIEVPVWYNDPLTNETGSRFRAGFHQRPEGNDLDYAAEVNGLADSKEFIRRHHERPWLVTMVGFVAGLPFMFQLAPRQEQLEVPKYLSPRTDTPPLTIGHGGCFSCIYSVRGAGGYQMFGVAAAPIYQPEAILPDFQDFAVLFRPGDVIKFTPVTEAEYQRIQAEVEAGTWRYRIAEVSFGLADALEDLEGTNRRILEALHGA